MGGIVITITSGKGGVGKTTTTANLGCALSLRGRKTVIVDGDIGLRNLDIIMGLENRIVYDAVDYVEGRCKLRQALIRDKRAPELYLLATAQTRDKTAVTPAMMVALCDELRADHDYVIVDSPAGIEQGFETCLAPADFCLVVTNPEVSSVRDSDRVIGLIESREKDRAVRLVINRMVAARVKKQDMLSVEDIQELLSTDIIGVVPEDEAILSSSNRGTPVTLNGKGPAAVAYTDIARRLMGEQVPIMTPQGGLFQRLLGRG